MAQSAQRRVVVTGTGVVSAVGLTVADFWESLRLGRTGVGPLAGIPLENIRTRIGAQIKGFNERTRLAHWKRDKTILHSDRYAWIAAAAADEAIAQAGLEAPFANPYRCVCIVGSGAGGMITGETACRDRFVRNKRAVHPMMLPRIIPSSAAAHIGIEYGIKGGTLATLGAGASALHAIGMGRDLVRWGQADVAIVGGTDSMITEGSLLACEALHLLSPDGCFPFARRRNGTVLAEGAGILVIEAEEHARARGARAIATLSGFAMTSNGDGLDGTDVETASATMRMALEDAGLAPSAIGHLNACAGGSVAGDRHEAEAVARVFGAHARAIAVSATKASHGHAFGASGALQSVAAIAAMQSGLAPPIAGLAEPDPAVDLDLVAGAARAGAFGHAMVNAFAVGGMSTSLVLARGA